MDNGLLTIGYGNALRGDDRVGWAVAEAVAAWNLPGVQAIAVPQLFPELAEALSQVDLAVFVDAAIPNSDGPNPRGLQVTDLIRDHSPSAPAQRLGSHGFDPTSLLQLAQILYGHAPRACWLLMIPAVDMGFKETLSDITQAGMVEALDWIRDLCLQLNR